VELCAFGCQLRPSPIVMTGGGEFAPVGEGLEILGHHGHCVLATVVTDGAGAGRLEGWTLISRVQRDRNRITIATDDRRQKVAVARDREVLHPSPSLIRPPARDASAPGPALQVGPGQFGPCGVGGATRPLLFAASWSSSGHRTLLTKERKRFVKIRAFRTGPNLAAGPS